MEQDPNPSTPLQYDRVSHELVPDSNDTENPQNDSDYDDTPPLEDPNDSEDVNDSNQEEPRRMQFDFVLPTIALVRARGIGQRYPVHPFVEMFNRVMQLQRLEDELNQVESLKNNQHQITPADFVHDVPDTSTESCVVCLNTKRRCVILDCFHLVVCIKCAYEIKDETCPICRVKITDIRMVYF